MRDAAGPFRYSGAMPLLLVMSRGALGSIAAPVAGLALIRTVA